MTRAIMTPEASARLSRTGILAQDVSRLKYVSGAREEALRRLGIETVGDLLLHIPRRYLDFTRGYSIETAPLGQVCTIIATVDRVMEKRPRPRLIVTEVMLVDDSGVLRVSFFKQPWIAKQLKPGDRLAVMGKVEFAYGFKQMASPHYEPTRFVFLPGRDCAGARCVRGLERSLDAPYCFCCLRDSGCIFAILFLPNWR